MGSCTENKRKSDKLYYEKNRAAIILRNCEYQRSHKEEVKKRHADHYKKNIDKCKEDRHNWYIRNSDMVKLKVKDWIKNNKDKVRVSARKYYMNNIDTLRIKERAHRIKHSYGITPDQYEKILQLQHGVCKICGKPPLHGKNLSIDHCHKTGEIRGLLCQKCNTALGHFNDDPILLDRAAEYLSNKDSNLGCICLRE